MKGWGFPITRPTDCVTSAWLGLFFAKFSSELESRFLKRLFRGYEPFTWLEKSGATAERLVAMELVSWKNPGWPTF